MTDDLKRECEEFLAEKMIATEWPYPVYNIDNDLLCSFAQRQYQRGQAAGLRKAEEHMEELLDIDEASSDDQMYAHKRWCAQRAREVENGK